MDVSKLRIPRLKRFYDVIDNATNETIARVSSEKDALNYHPTRDYCVYRCEMVLESSVEGREIAKAMREFERVR